MQLSTEPDQAGLPETTLLLGLLAGDADAVVTFIDLVPFVSLPNTIVFSESFCCIPYSREASSVGGPLQDTARPNWHGREDDDFALHAAVCRGD